MWCSGFESTTLPEGAIYKRYGNPVDWADDFVVDTEVFHSGSSSMRVKTTAEANMGGSASAYRMLAVPSGGSKFWSRVYLRSDMDLGAGTASDSEHNAWMGASTSDDPNGPLVEIANDCGIAFNKSDHVIRPESTEPNCATPYVLPPDTWYCIEASFDGATGNTQLYVDGELVIDAPAWADAQGMFTHFKFGVNVFGHTKYDRALWYDDVAVGPERIGCL